MRLQMIVFFASNLEKRRNKKVPTKQFKVLFYI